MRREGAKKFFFEKRNRKKKEAKEKNEDDDDDMNDVDELQRRDEQIIESKRVSESLWERRTINRWD